MSIEQVLLLGGGDLMMTFFMSTDFNKTHLLETSINEWLEGIIYQCRI